jgi:hypothetical protein
MGGIGDMLFGTEDKAYKQNLKNYKLVQQVWGDLKPEQAKVMQAYLAQQAGVAPLIQQAYAKAGKGLKQGAANQSKAILQNQKQQLAAVESAALSRGMSGTSVPLNLKRGVRADASTALASVQSAFSQLESELALSKGNALAGAKGNMANAYLNQIQQNLALAQGQTGGMTSFQFQGSPGLLQTAVSGAAQGLSQVGGMALGAAMFSDARMKVNVRRVGTSPSGIPISEFEYISQPGKRFRGVIAQDLIAIRPDAVVEASSGMLAVRYGEIDVSFEEAV